MPTYCIEVLCGPGRPNPKLNLDCGNDAEAIRKARRVGQNGYTVRLSQGLRPITAFKASVLAEREDQAAVRLAGASQ